MAEHLDWKSRAEKTGKIPALADIQIDEHDSFSESRGLRSFELSVEYGIVAGQLGSVFTVGADCAAQLFAGRSGAVEPTGAATSAGGELVREFRFGGDIGYARESASSGADQFDYGDVDFLNINRGRRDFGAGAPTGLSAFRDESEFGNGERIV
jgi:hypothetical protein